MLSKPVAGVPSLIATQKPLLIKKSRPTTTFYSDYRSQNTHRLRGASRYHQDRMYLQWAMLNDACEDRGRLGWCGVGNEYERQ
jgi:hypothetical protein